MTTSTRTLDLFRSVQHKTIGLCHEWIGVQARLAKYFGTQPEQIEARIAGINHLPWALDLQISGRNAWDDLDKFADMILTGEVDFDPDDNTPFADHGKVKATLFKAFGALPVAGDRHVAEFFGNFINSDPDFMAQYRLALTSVEYRAREMANERGLIESAVRGDLPVAPFLKKRSNEAASEIISALVTGGRYTGIMNLSNFGQITNLPREAVVETYGIIEPAGACGIAVGNVPAGVQTILERHIANQELTIKSALAGDRNLALQVLINDPLTRGLEIRKCQEMLAELLDANRSYLPIFFL
jgi:alpha-galactosidase